MRRTLRGAVAGSAVVGLSLLLAAPALAAAHTTPKPDPYLVADTEMTTPASIAGGGSTFAAPLENAAQAYYGARNGNATLAGLPGRRLGRRGVGPAEPQLQLGRHRRSAGPDPTSSLTSRRARATASRSSSQVPVGLGGEAIDYNLPGFKASVHLKLTAAIIAGIYKGTITTWNNPAIANLNKAVLKAAKKKLPAPADQVRGPHRQVRHDVHLHELPGTRGPVGLDDRTVEESADARHR